MRGSEWVAGLWHRRGFTLSGLARASGVSRRTLERVASGEYALTARTLLKLAGPLKLSARVVYLLLQGPNVDPGVLDELDATVTAAVSREEFENLVAHVEILHAELSRLAGLIDFIVKQKA